MFARKFSRRLLSTQLPPKSKSFIMPIAAVLAAGVLSTGYYVSQQKPVKVDEEKLVLVPDPNGPGVVEVQSLKNATPTPRMFPSKDSTQSLKNATATPNMFPSKDSTVIFVLGGPGAGKGTQCQKIVADYGFVHLSAGDLLRAEQNREGSQYGHLINRYIREGQIVPMEITIKLLERAMSDSGAMRFLIDGFPRKMDQAEEFERAVVPSRLILYFECPEEELLKRLMKRGETSGRSDDNVESIKKRFKTFTETSYAVIQHYEKLGKVKTISCLDSPDAVYANVKKCLDEVIAK